MWELYCLLAENVIAYTEFNIKELQSMKGVSLYCHQTYETESALAVAD